MPTSPLPEGYESRPARMEDIPGVTAMMIASDIELAGESDIDEEMVRSDWSVPGFDLEQDTCVVTAPAKNLAEEPIVVGFEECFDRANHARLEGDGYVHPEYTGRGVGTALLHWLEARARTEIPLAPPEARVSLRNNMYGHDQRGIELHKNEGYVAIRYFYQMRINLNGPPTEPAIPAGITITAPGEAEDRAIFDALEDAFRDHWGYVAWDFQRWLSHQKDPATYDPTVWFIARSGNEIAGAAICRLRGGQGWVSQLGVRRPWRRSGLGLALLYAAFGEFYRRGFASVGLGVDAANPTGATRLYERAGMRIHQQFVMVEKELRPGVELITINDR